MNELVEKETSDYGQSEDQNNNKTSNALLIRHARPDDGQKIWHLVKSTGILDLNSVYCYLLLCRHFSNTCLVAETGNDLTAFVTAYKIPGNETTLFIWQIGVGEKARGQGIAKKLIMALIESEHCNDINLIQATVSPSNTASGALFKSLARNLNTTIKEMEYFDSSLFPGQQHESENLITLGPFSK